MSKVSIQEQEWFMFILKNWKWNNKKNEWKFPKPREYHMEVKTIWKKSNRGSFNSEKKEKGYWETVFDRFEMGPQLFRFCQLCGKDLEEMRRDGKKVEKFCCKDHMIEYSKRKQIRKSESASGLTWKTNKGDKITRSDGMVSHYAGSRKNLPF